MIPFRRENRDIDDGMDKVIDDHGFGMPFSECEYSG